MPQLEVGGKTYEVDEDGFLQELDKWNRDFAQGYAALEGIEGRAYRGSLETYRLHKELLYPVRHRSYDQKDV